MRVQILALAESVAHLGRAAGICIINRHGKEFPTARKLQFKKQSCLKWLPPKSDSVNSSFTGRSGSSANLEVGLPGGVPGDSIYNER